MVRPFVPWCLPWPGFLSQCENYVCPSCWFVDVCQVCFCAMFPHGLSLGSRGDINIWLYDQMNTSMKFVLQWVSCDMWLCNCRTWMEDLLECQTASKSTSHVAQVKFWFFTFHCDSPPARWGLLDFMSVAAPPPLLLLLFSSLCSLPDLNHDQPRPVFAAGPQPRPSTPTMRLQVCTLRAWGTNGTIHLQMLPFAYSYAFCAACCWTLKIQHCIMRSGQNIYILARYDICIYIQRIFKMGFIVPMYLRGVA